MTAWQQGPTAPALRHASAHVWRASLRLPPAHHARLAALLSEDEAARAARLRSPQLRADFEASRGIQREVLSRYTGIPAEALAFTYSSFGKPALARYGRAPGLNFNISNAGGHALIGLALDRPIGVDLEPVHPVRQALAIAERFFSAAEFEALRTVPPTLLDRCFLTVWTRKEAFIKAVGEGLSLPLADFDVAPLPDQPARLLRTRPTDAAEQWTLRDVEPSEDFVACLAIQGVLDELRCYNWLPDGG